MSTAAALAHSATSKSAEQQSCEVGDELRCSRCYKTDAALVCAQCHRLLCTNCAELPGFFRVAVPIVSSPLESRQREEFVFCSEHRRSKMSVGALLFAVSLLVGVGSILAVPWLVFPAAAATVLALRKKKFVDQLAARWGKTKSNVFGLFARYEFEMTEHLTIDFDLGSRPYAKSKPAGGRLTLKVKLDHGDKDRFVKLGGARNFQEVHAGFYRLRGTRARPSGNHRSEPQLATAIRGQVPPNFLDFIPAHSIGLSSAYEIADASSDDERPRKQLPLHVVPNERLSTLNPRVWGLTFKTTDRSTRRMILKRLIVHVPAELKSIQSSDGVFESEQSRVVWRDILFNSEQPASIQVEFSEPIHAVREIAAEYEVGIDGSGLADLSVPTNCVWYPSGQRVEPERVTVVQTATVAGTIKAATRLQPKRQEIIEKKAISRPGRFLTIDLAHELIAGLSKRGLYAKDILEAPPSTVIVGTSQMTCRYWEIVGRYYVQNQPYDVHIVLTGQDQRGQARPTSEVRLDLEIVVRNLSELQFAPMESQKVDAAALDLLLVADQILGAQ